MSLRPLLRHAAQQSVDFDVPSEKWLNGNGAVFGGWTMFKACEMAIDHAKKLSIYAAVAIDERHNSPEFVMKAFKFMAPAHVGVPVRFDISNDDSGNITVRGADFHHRNILEASFLCSEAVKDYTPQDMVKLLEMMSLLDMEGGRKTNMFHPLRAEQVCVTGAIEDLRVYDLSKYQSVLPEGRFDLAGFKEERVGKMDKQGIVDERYFTLGESVSENLKAVSLEIGCAQDETVFAYVGAMVFVNVSRVNGKTVAMDWRAGQYREAPADTPDVRRA
jgi:hypothetical protein